MTFLDFLELDFLSGECISQIEANSEVYGLSNCSGHVGLT